MGANKLSRAALRRLSRTAALQLLFHEDGTDESDTSVRRTRDWFWEEFWTVDERGSLAPKQRGEVTDYAMRLVNGVDSFRAEIEAKIQEVSQNWGLTRMGRVDRNILRLSAYELMQEPGLPKSVAINEGIELAKTFGNEGSGRFVNGILDRIAKEME